MPPGGGDPVAPVAAGVRWFWRDLPDGRGGHRRIIGLRALTCAARRPQPGQLGVLSRQRRGERRAVGGGSSGFGLQLVISCQLSV